MKEEGTTPLRQRIIEDMRIRGMGDKAQQSHIRAIKDFASFLGRSPDTATPEDLRAYQFHMADTGVTPSTFNVRIVAMRFFFGMTCGREELKRYLQFRTEPRNLPVVLSVEEVSGILMPHAKARIGEPSHSPRSPGQGAAAPRSAKQPFGTHHSKVQARMFVIGTRLPVMAAEADATADIDNRAGHR